MLDDPPKFRDYSFNVWYRVWILSCSIKQTGLSEPAASGPGRPLPHEYEKTLHCQLRFGILITHSCWRGFWACITVDVSHVLLATIRPLWSCEWKFSPATPSQSLAVYLPSAASCFSPGQTFTVT